MTLGETKSKLTEISDNLGSSLQLYLMSAPVDEDTRIVLDEIVHQLFNSFCESRDVLLEYLESK